MVDHGRDSPDPEQNETSDAEPRHGRRLAGALILAAGIGSGAVVIVDPALGAALGTVASVLAALDSALGPRPGRRSRARSADRDGRHAP
ncbi:hypothetical protein [Frankia sp. QA3]|uniref:hypothetical protein n=1 Tax=Frankia sp. QA3 TaxID=710111 RepID=UPI000269CF3E|nr:hypothetical protein [Frankia sp. QA3]EIV96315.1 hypothetical protein FraQA3DRAFT_6198 [Frankia sp. QA3]